MDPRDLENRLKSRGALDGSACPACGELRWAAPANLDEVRLPVTVGEQEGHWRVLAIVCRNCGYIRLHDRRTLDPKP